MVQDGVLTPLIHAGQLQADERPRRWDFFEAPNLVVRESLLLPLVKDALIGVKPLIRLGDRVATTAATTTGENLMMKN